MKIIDKGALLECRVQRLSFAQGIFAERGLVPAASRDHRLLATDIDVLTSDYSPSFHATRGHFECKSGKIKPLDRVLWLSGVRALLNADASTLVMPAVDGEVVAFGRLQNIDIMTEPELDNLETCFSIQKDVWPARSNGAFFGGLKQSWAKAYGAKEPGESWRALKGILSFVEVDSWLQQDFRIINTLLRLLLEASGVYRSNIGEDVKQCSAYCLNALTVRLAQLLLFVCRKYRGIHKNERKAILEQKLTFGETNPSQARGLIEGTHRLLAETYKANGSTSNIAVDLSRFSAPPEYSKDFIALVDVLISRPLEAKCLVLSSEMMCFSNDAEYKDLGPLAESVAEGTEVAELLGGFVQRLASLAGIPSLTSEPAESTGN